MPPGYVAPDGTVGGRKPIIRQIKDFIFGIFDFIGLFFSAITNPPQRIESQATYAQRNRGQSYRTTGRNNNSGGGGRPLGGSNIRGMKNLQGDCTAKMGG